ncbi:MAG: Txe/YoeB family addiction module toxin [Erysipelotrichaceae bacterium]|nr:Txe/YoeB family addiction module toxin [Erysipelotrichaceae bacterium]
MRLLWDERAWDDYLFWQSEDKKTLRKVNVLLREIARDPFHGSGKPEPLKGDLHTWWSRRIDKKNRIVYTVKEDCILIASCKNHYSE